MYICRLASSGAYHSLQSRCVQSLASGSLETPSTPPITQEAPQAPAVKTAAVGVMQPAGLSLESPLKAIASSSRPGSPVKASMGDKSFEAAGCAATGAGMLQGEGTQVRMSS